MKARMLLFTILFAGLLGSCATPDTTALRIGMTKDEVIRVMGQPESVSANGSYEYLNYTLESPAGYGRILRPYFVRFQNGVVESYGNMAQLPRNVTVTRTVQSASGDAVKILSVSPDAVVPGQATEVKVRVSYSLASVPQAMVNVAFNLLADDKFRSVNHQVVDRGSGEAEIVAKVTPVDWGHGAPFVVQATLLPYPRTPESHSIALVQQELTLKR